jgi:two-component system, response regulator PdtaR
MNILIVEDEAVIATGLEWSLEELRHTVVGSVRSSEEALDFCRRQPPDLALVDIGLEGPGNGITLATALQELEIPIVFMSAHYELAWSHREIALGFIGKPYSAAHVSECMQAVEELLRGQKPTAGIGTFEVFGRGESSLTGAR